MSSSRPILRILPLDKGLAPPLDLFDRQAAQFKNHDKPPNKKQGSFEMVPKLPCPFT